MTPQQAAAFRANVEAWNPKHLRIVDDGRDWIVTYALYGAAGQVTLIRLPAPTPAEAIERFGARFWDAVQPSLGGPRDPAVERGTQTMTTDEAAAYLGYSPQRIRQLAQAGRLPGAERRGRDWTIPTGALDGYQPAPRGWPKGKPRKREPCTGHDELIALMQANGVQMVRDACQPDGLGLMVQHGWDLTRWRTQTVPGAIMFYRVEGPGKSGVVSDEPKLLIVNAPASERPRWAARLREWGDEGDTILLMSQGGRLV